MSTRMKFDDILTALKAGALITCDKVVNGDHYEDKWCLWINCERGRSPQMIRLHKDHMIGLFKQGLLKEDKSIKPALPGREHYIFNDFFQINCIN